LEKSSLSDWKEEDLVAINQIIIRCAVKFQNAIDKYSNPNKYASKMATQLKSNKNLSSLFLFSQLTTLKNDALYSPSELKAEVIQDMKPGIIGNIEETKIADDMTKEILSNKYVSNSTLSKVLKEFTHYGLLVHLDNKNQLKNFRATHTTNHKNIYKTGGRISFYTISPDFETTSRLLSNPKAVEIISASLKESGLLDRYLKIMIKSYIYFLTRKHGLEETELVKQAAVTLFTSIYPGLQLDMKIWEPLKDRLSSLDENAIDKIVEMVIPCFEDLGFPFYIDGLSKL
jgi:hypothetical protein